MQEGPVALGHHPLLGLADEVSLLLVRDGPALLGLAQLLQPVVEALVVGGWRWGFVYGNWEAIFLAFLKTMARQSLILQCVIFILKPTLNLSLITCRSLSLS